MSKIGFRSYVGLADESTFGSAVAPTSYIEYNTEGFKKTFEEILIDAINGTAQYKKRVRGAENVEAALTFPLVPTTAAKFLKHFCDSVTTTTLTTGVYQHVLTARTLCLEGKSFTFNICRDTDDTATSIYYTGVKGTSIVFSVDNAGVLNVNFTGIGKDAEAANTIGTASYKAVNPYVFHQGTIKIGDTEAAATTTSIQGWTLNLANDILEDRSIGEATRDKIDAGMNNVTTDIVSRFDDATLYNRFINGTKTYIQAEFEGDSITAAYNHKVTFKQPNTYFNGETPNIGSANELISATFPTRSIFEDATMSAMQITIINDSATI